MRSNKFRCLPKGLALALLLLAGPAQADLLLTYESATPLGGHTSGNSTGIYAEAAIPVTASFTFESFPASWSSDRSTLEHWSISDGHQVLTDTNSRLESWLFLNDAAEGPRVAFWAFDLGDSTRSIQSAYDLFPWTVVTETRRFDMVRFGEGNFATNFGTSNPVGTWKAVSVPELVIFPKFLPRLLGWGVEAKITHALQRATTWLAAAILRAPHSATEIYLPALTVKVIAECSGYQTLLFLLGVAGLLAAVKRRASARASTVVTGPATARHAPDRASWQVASQATTILLLFLAAALLALEANALRVVLIALGGEHRDGIQYGTTAFAVGQLVLVGRWAGR